jgi:serine/threonine protein kinase
MAPEQLWGREIDQRTDVYAVGMSLYECLTGEVPYNGTYPEVLVQVSNAPAPPAVRDKRPDVPPALAVVIETALEKDAADRFQSASELGRALVAASGLAPGRSALLAAAADDAPTSTETPVEEEPERAIKLVRKKAPRGESDRQSAVEPITITEHRRQFVRAPYVTPVVLRSRTGSEIHARSEEISEEGMLVVSPLGFVLGASLEVRFASPLTGEMIGLQAAVRWTREGRGRTAMGLEFAAVPEAVRGIIAQYIGMLPAAQQG